MGEADPTKEQGQGAGPAGVVFDLAGGVDAERAAMLLAITRTREEEEATKAALARVGGLRFAVTELGGMSETVRAKIAPQMIGASLSQGVVRKTSSHIHALLHAVLEAERGFLMDVPMNSSVSLKIAVVTQGSWIVAAIFGDSGFHVLTNHRRAGLGAMHFPQGR